MTTTQAHSAESRLDQLIERLLWAGEQALERADVEQARSMADDVLTVDAGNARALRLIERLEAAARPPAGQRSLMTILFSDLADSTRISEAVEPEAMRDIYQRYREVAHEAVERFEGKVIQFLGDGIVATFGFPHSHEDDAQRAVLAALALLDGMHEVHSVAERHGAAARARVGIHTGVVVVADLGAAGFAERDAIVGVAPNLAARLQSEAEPGMVVISDVTQQLVDADFDLRSLGFRQMKGITRGVEVFAVVGARHTGSRLEAARFRTPMVGRDPVRAELAEAWSRTSEVARSGVGGKEPPIVVVGEAGIGKSRLVAELRNMATDAGGETLEFGCLPYYTNSAFWPVRQMVKRMLGVAPDTSRAELVRTLVADLERLDLDRERLVPLIAPIVGVTEVPGYAIPEIDPSALRQLTLDSLTEWIGRRTERTPRLLVAEDLHWADPSTLDLLARLAVQGLAGLMLVVTTRYLPEAAWLEQAHVVRLERLTAEASTSLVEALPGGEGMPDHVRQSIVDRAEGVPLFVEELTRSALETPGSEQFPLRLQELLTARLRAPGIDLHLVQLAATIGEVWDVGTLQAITGSIPDLVDRIARIREAGIIDPIGDPAGGRYRFRHALLRDAAYETQVLDGRRTSHGRVATVLNERGVDAAVVARHFDLAGDGPGAVAQYMAGAQHSQSLGAHEEATRLLTRTLEILATFPESGERDGTELAARMLRSLSVSSVHGYAAPDVVADFERSEELTVLLGGVPATLPALLAIWSYFLVSGDIPGAARLCDRIVALAAQEAVSWFRPEAETAAGFQRFFEGDLRAAAGHFTDAVAGYEARAPDEVVSVFWPLPHDPVAVAAVGLFGTMTLRGDAAGAARAEELAITRAAAVPFPRGPFSRGFVDVYRAWQRFLMGDRAGAQALGEEAIAIGMEHGFAYWVAIGSVYHRLAQPDVAAIEEALTVLRMIGHRAFWPSYLGYVAIAHAEAGFDEDAMASVDEAIETAEQSTERVHVPDLLHLRATLELGRPKPDHRRAASDLRESHRVAMEQGAMLIALRSANALSALPDDVRPTDWSDLVGAALADIPGEPSYPEVAEARAKLTS